MNVHYLKGVWTKARERMQSAAELFAHDTAIRTVHSEALSAGLKAEYVNAYNAERAAFHAWDAACEIVA